ncbi:MAG: IclR family transcriptional regulator [Cellulomonas sp.]
MSTSVDRALDILDTIALTPMRPGELGEKLGVHRSTVVRLLQTLESRDYARRLPSGKWGIGFGLISSGQRALDSIDVRETARRHLVSLGNELGHTIHLAGLMGAEIVYLDKIEGLGAVKMASRIGGRALIHTAGVSKAILAFAPIDVRAAAVAGCNFERYTPTTITTPAAFAAELETIADRGWAIDNGEAEDYINCVAVPIFGNDGSVVAGLSVTALTAIAPFGTLEARIDRVLEAGAAISADLGWDETVAS